MWHILHEYNFNLILYTTQAGTEETADDKTVWKFKTQEKKIF
jgi:hypothetical protein